MPIKTKKRVPGRKSAPLSRTDLLPLGAARAKVLSLTTHMALAAVRSGHGDLTMLGELLRTVYIVYFICEAEHHIPLPEDFINAERCLKASMDVGEAEGLWKIGDNGMDSLEAVMALHDLQLVNKPSYRIDQAKDQLRTVLDKGVFPDLAHHLKIANPAAITA